MKKYHITTQVPKKDITELLSKVKSLKGIKLPNILKGDVKS